MPSASSIQASGPRLARYFRVANAAVSPTPSAYLGVRQNSVSRLSSYLYLVPPLTAIEAYLLFNERLSLAAIGGMALVAVGVALVVVRRTAQA